MLKIPLFVVVTIVATLNLSLAQSQNDSSSDSHQHSFFGIPIPHFQFPPFQIPQFQIPQFPGIREQEAGGPPADASADSSTDHVSSEHDQDHQDRFFFGLFRPASTLVACNYTTQGGTSCTSCTTALTCGTANVGRRQVCRGFFPYCNLGRCSFFPGELCTNSTG